jgi:hypothetical protein
VSDPATPDPVLALSGGAVTPGCVSGSSDKRDRALVVDRTRCMVAQRVTRSSRAASRDGHPPLQLFPDRRAPCH